MRRGCSVVTDSNAISQTSPLGGLMPIKWLATGRLAPRLGDV